MIRRLNRIFWLSYAKALGAVIGWCINLVVLYHLYQYIKVPR